MVSVHTASPPTVHAAYTSGVSVTVQSAIPRALIWTVSKLKLEHRSSERVLEKKEGTVVCCSRKPSFLNTKCLSIVISHTHCVAFTSPMLFQVQPETKKEKPPGTNFACIAISFPCFLPDSDSEWPQHVTISDPLYAETHQCFLAKSILELKTREKQENCRDFKSTSQEVHK